MMQPLTFLLAGWLPLGAGDPPPVTLFDFGKGFERKLLSATDAAASVTRAGTLSLRTGHRVDWPGATLKAPRGKWDLSPRARSGAGSPQQRAAVFRGVPALPTRAGGASPAGSGWRPARSAPS
jgi:hypothetical protein